MSIIIRGMDMPTSCRACMFSRTDIRGVEWCTRTGKDLPCDCPIVEVPPHGLIDREQILDSIDLELAMANAVNDMDDYDAWLRVFHYVRKFPAIIEAEVKE